MARTVLALNLLPPILASRPLGQRPDDVDIAFGDDGRFAKGPAQIGIAQFGAAQALDLAGAGHRAFDQAAVGQKIFDGGEAVRCRRFRRGGSGPGVRRCPARFEAKCSRAGRVASVSFWSWASSVAIWVS